MRLAQATSIASTILALALCKPAQGQTSPPAPSSLEDITGCSLDGDSVFIAIGRDATARRYRYPWDPSIDALCNAKGFAIGAPKGAAAATRTPAPSQAPA